MTNIKRKYLSAYTPSNTDPEILEQIFVQRHQLLEKTVGWCQSSILTSKKNQLLFIAPRGCGKTHLLSMVVNRLKQNAALTDKMHLVWLGEDLIITQLLDLLLAILENLVKNNPQSFHKDCLQEAKGQPPAVISQIIMHSISEQLHGRTLLLVKENMSDVFNGLKDDGQKKLRAFFQETNQIATLTTSQQLFSGVSSRDAAFFGFFDTHHLYPLTTEQAKQLISNIATLNNQMDLVDFLASEQGEFRLRALHHLAGGNHRLYIELAAFLTVETLDDFVSAMVELADSLTPYFQERIRTLPPQQGKIVQKLCDLQGATPVKIIAEESFIDERSVAKQLGELAKKGYVISHKRGKQSFYEMAEPLMRLSLEVKESQGKPLKMIALLLRTWFSDKELQQPEKGLLGDYKQAALLMGTDILVHLNNDIHNEAGESFNAKDYLKTIKFCSQIIASPEANGKPLEQKAQALLNRSITYRQQNQTNKALKDLTTLISLKDAPIELIAKALFNRSVTYSQQNQINKTLKDLTTLISLKDAPINLITDALFNRSLTYRQQDQTNKALKDLTTLISLKDAPIDQIAEALFVRSLTYGQQNQTNKALKDLTTLISLKDAPIERIAKALLIRSLIYSQQNQFDKSIIDLNLLISLQDPPLPIKTNALFFITECYFKTVQIKKAHTALNKALNLINKQNELKSWHTADFIQAIVTLGSAVWQKEIPWLFKVYQKYDLLAPLALLLIGSIKVFAEDPSQQALFENWLNGWQAVGQDIEEMETCLMILEVAHLVFIEKNDKPLFRLPKEVRALVLPLLEAVLK